MMIDYAMELVIHRGALVKEISCLEAKLEDHDTGHIRTTIGVLQERVSEIDDLLTHFDSKTRKLILGC